MRWLLGEDVPIQTNASSARATPQIRVCTRCCAIQRSMSRQLWDFSHREWKITRTLWVFGVPFDFTMRVVASGMLLTLSSFCWTISIRTRKLKLRNVSTVPFDVNISLLHISSSLSHDLFFHATVQMVDLLVEADKHYCMLFLTQVDDRFAFPTPSRFNSFEYRLLPISRAWSKWMIILK